MNAVSSPANGTLRSSSSVRARRTATATAITARAPKNIDAGAETIPSLMCIADTVTAFTAAA